MSKNPPYSADDHHIGYWRYARMWLFLVFFCGLLKTIRNDWMDNRDTSAMMRGMLGAEIHRPHVNALAERLVADIRRRGLEVGDRYMTVEAVSRMLGGRRAVAGKAIQ